MPSARRGVKHGMDQLPRRGVGAFLSRDAEKFLRRPSRMRVVFYAPLSAARSRRRQISRGCSRPCGGPGINRSSPRGCGFDGSGARGAAAAQDAAPPSGWCGTGDKIRMAGRRLVTYHLLQGAGLLVGSGAASGSPMVAEVRRREAGGRAVGERPPCVDRLRQADAVIGLNSADRDAVLPLRDPRRWLPCLCRCGGVPGPRRGFQAAAIAVAMMRPGDKLASYQVLGRRWHIARSAVVAGGCRRRSAPERSAYPVAARHAGSSTTAAWSEGWHRALAGADHVWPASTRRSGWRLSKAQWVACRRGRQRGRASSGRSRPVCSRQPAMPGLRRVPAIADPAARSAMGLAARAQVRRGMTFRPPPHALPG